MLERVRAQVWLNPTETEYAEGEGEAAAASASCCLKCLPAATLSERSKKLEHSRITSLLSTQPTTSLPEPVPQMNASKRHPLSYDLSLAALQ
jgi:hypothetical protein